MSEKVDTSREAVERYALRIFNKTASDKETVALLRALASDQQDTEAALIRYVENAKVEYDQFCAERVSLRNQLAKVTAERDALLAANESLAKDAERYRWLRTDHVIEWPPVEFPTIPWPVRMVRENNLPVTRAAFGADLDAAIDAALAASASAKEKTP